MKVTTDHNTIRNWAKIYKGRPEIIANSETETGGVGIRIDFPGELDDMYLSEVHEPEDVSWNEFFRIFEEQNLALEYEDGKKTEDPSNAYRFIRRENLDSE